MNILGIDTSFTYKNKIVLYRSDEEILEITLNTHTSQERNLLYLIQQSMEILGIKPSDIDRIVVGLGPGSFTGLRVGIGAARALSWINQVDIYGISSLYLIYRSIPESVSRNRYCAVMIEARMGKIFAGIYYNNQEVLADNDFTPIELKSELALYAKESWLIIGNAHLFYTDILADLDEERRIIIEDLEISGKSLYEIGFMEDHFLLKKGLDQVFPEYKRKSEAENQYDIKQGKSI